jgi:hypothetical protein
MPFFLSHFRLLSQETLSVLIPPALVPRFLASGRPQQKSPICNNSFIVADVFVVAGNCLPSSSLPSNKNLLWPPYSGFQATCQYNERNEIRAQAPDSVVPCFKKSRKYGMRVSCDFSFQDTRYHQMTQVIR